MQRSFKEELLSSFAAGQDNDKQLGVMIERARDAGLSTALDLITFLDQLPAALVHTKEQELERLSAQEDETHPRIAALQAEIDATRAMAKMAALGKARMERAVAAQLSRDWTLYGFVSDTDGEPLPGWRVTLTARLLDAPLQAITENDGYFGISIARANADTIARIAHDDNDPKGNAGRIEVFTPDGRVPAYTDPLPVAVGSGHLAVRQFMIDVIPERQTR